MRFLLALFCIVVGVIAQPSRVDAQFIRSDFDADGQTDISDPILTLSCAAHTIAFQEMG